MGGMSKALDCTCKLCQWILRDMLGSWVGGIREEVIKVWIFGGIISWKVQNFWNAARSMEAVFLLNRPVTGMSNVMVSGNWGLESSWCRRTLWRSDVGGGTKRMTSRESLEIFNNFHSTLMTSEDAEGSQMVRYRLGWNGCAGSTSMRADGHSVVVIETLTSMSSNILSKPGQLQNYLQNIQRLVSDGTWLQWLGEVHCTLVKSLSQILECRDNSDVKLNIAQWWSQVVFRGESETLAEDQRGVES